MEAARDHEEPAGGVGATPDGPAIGPTVRRIALGSSLRRLREQAGIDRETAGNAIRGSVAKISRIETGRVGFKIRDVSDLLSLYGVTDPAERAVVLDLARHANQPGWWYRYNDLLPSWSEIYLGLEQDAAVIRTFALQFVPELLQTPGYARAVTELAATGIEEIERRVELRIRRQQLLTRDDPPMFWAVIDESVLRRSVCDEPDVLRAQLIHLLEVNERPNVSLQFVPLSHGGHPTAGGSFTLLRFTQRDLPDVVYLEQLTNAQCLDKRSDTERYTTVMERLVRRLAPPSHAAATLQRILRET
jgi:hypothetical protein